MAFELQRPLVFISVETTGLKVQKDDRLVELAMIKLFPPPAEVGISTALMMLLLAPT